MAPCCIKGCNNRGEKRSKKNSGITYHLFPRDMVKRRRWVAALGRADWAPSNATVVCSDHFVTSSFYSTQYGLKRLLDHAVPTLNTRIHNQAETSSDDLLRRLECALAGDGDGGLPASCLFPDAPRVTAAHDPATRRLAAQFLRLTVIYDKQKKKVRNLRQKLRRSDDKLRRFTHPPHSPVESSDTDPSEPDAPSAEDVKMEPCNSIELDDPLDFV